MLRNKLKNTNVFRSLILASAQNKLVLALGLLSVALVFSACGFNKPTVNSQNTQEQTTATTTADTSESVTIAFTDSGFDPISTAVKSGGEITWTNNSKSTVEIGSNPHPGHTDNQDITGNKFVIELAPGESSTVTVTKSGTFGFHDHLKPSFKGTVIVK